MINRVIIFFILFSLVGWVWESIYCTAKDKKWANRGFLFGPICPIYGCGSMLGLLIYDLTLSGKISDMPIWQVFLISFAVSMVLEYPISWILEKLFHARWWDYSKVPLNINGRTSVPTSLGFGVGGVLIVKILIPFAAGYIDILSPLIMNIIALILVCVLTADVTLTVTELTDFQHKVERLNDEFQSHMTDTVDKFYLRQSYINKKALEGIAVYKFEQEKKEVAIKLQELREEYRLKMKKIKKIKDKV